jgi:hypothetical protein
MEFPQRLVLKLENYITAGLTGWKARNLQAGMIFASKYSGYCLYGYDEPCFS